MGNYKELKLKLLQKANFTSKEEAEAFISSILTQLGDIWKNYQIDTSKKARRWVRYAPSYFILNKKVGKYIAEIEALFVNLTKKIKSKSNLNDINKLINDVLMKNKELFNNPPSTLE